jgi:hypothetical protein
MGSIAACALGAISIAVSCIAQTANAQGETLVWIVHPENRIQSIDESQAHDFLLKKKTAWPNGDPVHLYIPANESDSFKGLIKNICGMSLDDWDSYWLKEGMTGQTPPKTISDDIIILRIVSKDVNAIGIVPEESIRGEMREKIRVVLKPGGKIR